MFVWSLVSNHIQENYNFFTASEKYFTLVRIPKDGTKSKKKYIFTCLRCSEAAVRRCFSKDLKACNFINNRLQHRCFPVKIVKFLRTAFIIVHLPWLLLDVDVAESLFFNGELKLPYRIPQWAPFLYKKLNNYYVCACWGVNFVRFIKKSLFMKLAFIVSRQLTFFLVNTLFWRYKLLDL